MKKLLLALVYTALTLLANTATADMSEIEALREGDMKKLVFHSAPQPVTDAAFDLEDGGGTGTLADYRGKYVLLNFWATWCAPCRKEMPMLSALQSELGGETFEVLTLATGRNSPTGIQKFFDEMQITNLSRHQDPKQAVARDMAVLGLPITVLIDPEGREIARLRGDADWGSVNALTILRAVIAQ